MDEELAELTNRVIKLEDEVKRLQVLVKHLTDNVFDGNEFIRYGEE